MIDRQDNKSNKYWFKLSLVLLTAIMTFVFLQSSLPATFSTKESGIIVGFLGEKFGWSPDNAVFLVRKIGHLLEYLAMGLALGFITRIEYSGPKYITYPTNGNHHSG